MRAIQSKTNPVHVIVCIMLLGSAVYLLSKADITGRIHNLLP